MRQKGVPLCRLWHSFTEAKTDHNNSQVAKNEQHKKLLGSWHQRCLAGGESKKLKVKDFYG
jgi:hypothetical protein